MFWIFSLIYYVLVQTLGLVIAFVAAAVLLYLLLRRSHSRSITVLMCTVFLGISIFFYVPNGLPQGLEYPAFLKTYGPAGSPGLPFGNVLNFFGHINQFEKVADIARDPNDIPPPITRTSAAIVPVDITAKEVIAELAPGVYQNYWTFGGKVPGPFVRAREGDTVVVTFHNDATSLHHHTIDFHSVIGPGGGAGVLMADPGETKTLTFTALRPGLYVYHCAEPNAATHMAHGQYGLMLVEPKEGLSKIDKEFYIMQGEFYTTGTLGKKGLQIFDSRAMLNGNPQYIVFNGRVGALTSTSSNALNAHTGESVRMFVGNGGVNLISSFHVIGEIFERVFAEGSLKSQSLTDVQTTIVPAGGATMVEFTPLVPGNYTLVDHALARVDRGAWGVLHINGSSTPGVFSGVMQSMEGH